MHADDGEGDLGDVAMPGFIDILSSVITVFMFFMLITSAVLFFMSIAMRDSAKNEGRKETQSRVSGEVEQMVKEVQAGRATLEQLTQKLEAMKSETPPPAPPDTQPTENAQTATASPDSLDSQQQSRVTFSRSGSQSVAVGSDMKQVTIVFSDRGISVTDDTAKKITDFVASARASGRAIHVDLDVPDNPNAATLSISREIALGRSLNVRNVLLQNKLKPGDISIHTVPPEQYQNGYDWVRLDVK